jgi:tagatose-6-phosphate ketose/aldose isomerase
VDQDAWLRNLASQDAWRDLLAPACELREAAGYEYTLQEICQQPSTWTDTACRVAKVSDRLADLVSDCEWVAITGSGSSQYAGECVHPALQPAIGLPVFTLGGGWLLVEGSRSVPAARPGLLVSLSRSGESPESTGAVEFFLETEPLVRHLIITCNESGRLATRFGRDPRVVVLQLDPRTNDRSLVMTSSFTNMVIACRALGCLGEMESYIGQVDRLASAARDLLLCHADTLAGAARGGFQRVVYLGSGCRFGAAREASLKMLEMNRGRILTMAETYLGLRHGPMCAIDENTLVVCFLDSGPLARAYEEDLIGELDRKGLGARKLIVGGEIPAGLLADGDVSVAIGGLAALGDSDAPVLDVVAGQLLAFFRCLAGGLRPDLPSQGVITRVVNGFTVHRTNKGPETCDSSSLAN